MSIGFFIVGGIVFATYVYLTIWNINHSAKQSKKENYPNLGRDVAEKHSVDLFIKNKAA